MNETSRRVETALRDAVRQRNYRRIRDRALARLKKLYPDDYAQLLEQERARDEQEGKSWLDITGRTERTVDSAGSPDGNSSTTEQQANGNQQDEGNLE